jgi:hypothetical protein
MAKPGNRLNHRQMKAARKCRRHAGRMKTVSPDFDRQERRLLLELLLLLYGFFHNLLGCGLLRFGFSRFLGHNFICVLVYTEAPAWLVSPER